MNRIKMLTDHARGDALDLEDIYEVARAVKDVIQEQLERRLLEMQDEFAVKIAELTRSFSEQVAVYKTAFEQLQAHVLNRAEIKSITYDETGRPTEILTKSLHPGSAPVPEAMPRKEEHESP